MLKIIEKNINQEIKKIQNRLSFDNHEEENKVKKILENVKTKGDKALFEYTEAFDKVKLKAIEVDFLEIEEAHISIKDDILATIRVAIKNVADFHFKQLPSSWGKTVFDKSLLAWRYSPLQKVGIYVPGGTAAYPSSVIMNTVPAKIAGVPEIVMVTPPDKTGQVPALTLAVAKEVGIEKIYKIGGAHAVAALAYGTKTISPVDKIVGPGNLYVTLAKKLVLGTCGIDKLAGPSDVLVLADETANPAYIAADLLAQAEHDIFASSILITTSKEVAEKVNKEILVQMKKLSRKQIIQQSLKENSIIIIAKNEKEMIKFSDKIAPEHLEIMTKDPLGITEKVKNAGAIFLGDYAPTSLGDYLLGPNHVLPTSGNARFDSPLSVHDFIKTSSISQVHSSLLKAYAPDVEKFALLEGLDAHANAVKIRMSSLKNLRS